MLWKVQQIRWVYHEWLASITKSNYRKIVWIYCLGHAGVRGNERSDSLASRPHITGLHMAEMMRDINMFRGWNCNWENSTVEVTELRNLIEKGTGLRDRSRGQTRLVVNQCATEETPGVGADVGAHTQTRNICNQKQTCQFSCLKLLIVFPEIGSSVGEIILPLPAFSFIFLLHSRKDVALHFNRGCFDRRSSPWPGSLVPSWRQMSCWRYALRQYYYQLTLFFPGHSMRVL